MKNALLIFFLSAVAVLSFYMVRNLEQDLVTQEEDAKVTEVLIGHNVKASYFDSYAKLEYVITSDTVTDLSKNAGTKFTYPHVDYFDNKLLQWTAKSKKGFMTADRNDLTLSEDVLFVDSPNGKRPMVITSSVMYYQDLTNMVSSDKLSLINDGVVRQESAKFYMNTVTKIIDFNEAIKGRYKTSSEP